jgi:hypothetical protein
MNILPIPHIPIYISHTMNTMDTKTASKTTTQHNPLNHTTTTASKTTTNTVNTTNTRTTHSPLNHTNTDEHRPTTSSHNQHSLMIHKYNVLPPSPEIPDNPGTPATSIPQTIPQEPVPKVPPDPTLFISTHRIFKTTQDAPILLGTDAGRTSKITFLTTYETTDITTNELFHAQIQLACRGECWRTTDTKSDPSQSGFEAIIGVLISRVFPALTRESSRVKSNFVQDAQFS